MTSAISSPVPAPPLSQPADFRCKLSFADRKGASAIHIHNGEITDLLFEARGHYITEAVGLTWSSLHATGRNLITRRLVVDFERESSFDDDLFCAVRARLRSRRTLTLEEVLFTGAGQAVARAESVHVAVRFDTPGAMELPADMLAAFEGYEGRPIPMRA